MEPTLAGGPGDLDGLRLDLLRRAAEIYLELAYPAGAVPDAVQRRLSWRDGCPADELLSRPPFERTGKTPGCPTPVSALRLGNHRYPHMKLQIQPGPTMRASCLSVNTHDQVTGISLGSVDAQAFRDLQDENQRLKGSDRAGVGRSRPCPPSSATSAITSRAEGRNHPQSVGTRVLRPARRDRDPTPQS